MVDINKLITPNEEFTPYIDLNLDVLNSGQKQAYNTFVKFTKQSKKAAMLLTGGAGVGKSFTTAFILKSIQQSGVSPSKVVVCAPTHKAVGVLKRFMRESGLEYIVAPQTTQELKRQIQYNRYKYILATTSKALSIKPLLDDEEEIETLASVKDKVKFDKGGFDFLMATNPKFLLVDEVSMLPRKQFLQLVKWCAANGCKMVMIGDKGQLPPVGSQAIPFDRVQINYELTENMRSLGSAGANIVELGKAVRFGGPGEYKKVTGEGIQHCEQIRREFLKVVKAPGEDETEWTVFIGYKNKTVNSIREHACQKVYGHGSHTFGAGEVVVSDQRFEIRYNDAIDNQGVLKILSVGDTCPVKGVNVELQCVETGRVFWAWHLGKKFAEDKNHPFNIELVKRQKLAKELEALKRTTPDEEYTAFMDEERKTAWMEFFEWRDRTIIDIYHPFSLTSHKSQGSTFGVVFVAAPELERYNKRALYVAVSRARYKVVLQVAPTRG